MKQQAGFLPSSPAWHGGNQPPARWTSRCSPGSEWLGGRCPANTTRCAQVVCKHRRLRRAPPAAWAASPLAPRVNRIVCLRWAPASAEQIWRGRSDGELVACGTGTTVVAGLVWLEQR